MRLLDDLTSLFLICGLFGVAPAAIGLFLAVGLRKHRDKPIPGLWWMLMLVTCAVPASVLGLGFIFQADRPQLHHEHQAEGGQFLGAAIIVALIVLPLALIRATDRLSDRAGEGWQLGLVIAPLIILPVDFVALLAAAQMTSGVSL